MVTKLPQVKIKIKEELDKEVCSNHDAEKEQHKTYTVNKRRAKEKKITPGDKILISIKPPWDHKPFTVVDVQGSKVKGQKEELRTGSRW